MWCPDAIQLNRHRAAPHHLYSATRQGRDNGFEEPNVGAYRNRRLPTDVTSADRASVIHPVYSLMAIGAPPSMRKAWSIRLRLPEHQGRQIHELALKESRSQSSMISILVAESVAARRSTSASTQKLVSILRGKSAGPAHD